MRTGCKHTSGLQTRATCHKGWSGRSTGVAEEKITSTGFLSDSKNKKINSTRG